MNKGKPKTILPGSEHSPATFWSAKRIQSSERDDRGWLFIRRKFIRERVRGKPWIPNAKQQKKGQRKQRKTWALQTSKRNRFRTSRQIGEKQSCKIKKKAEIFFPFFPSRRVTIPHAGIPHYYRRESCSTECLCGKKREEEERKKERKMEEKICSQLGRENLSSGLLLSPADCDTWLCVAWERVPKRFVSSFSLFHFRVTGLSPKQLFFLSTSSFSFFLFLSFFLSFILPQQIIRVQGSSRRWRRSSGFPFLVGLWSWLVLFLSPI